MSSDLDMLVHLDSI